VRLLSPFFQQFRHGHLRGEAVALQLDGGQRQFREPAVGMQDGVARILPALVEVSLRAASGIFLKAIAVAISEGLAPMQPGQGRRQMRLQEPGVSGPSPRLPKGQAIE
jgi:hypothetical protein